MVILKVAHKIYFIDRKLLLIKNSIYRDNKGM